MMIFFLSHPHLLCANVCLILFQGQGHQSTTDGRVTISVNSNLKIMFHHSSCASPLCLL